MDVVIVVEGNDGEHDHNPGLGKGMAGALDDLQQASPVSLGSGVLTDRTPVDESEQITPIVRVIV